ncbi:alpha/beta hydrolase [Robertkochia sediminum]|uniref:alpha/beta hydrolase n=1 Tax=Robertkochia sediminum TaxID=2785326 RepID=UPI001932294D|nr:alpha/beta hydrolase [Robertkochia sediminum]MBL7473139.1 alpha/beta hydrolase [Robertkochia sediminum]
MRAIVVSLLFFGCVFGALGQQPFKDPVFTSVNRMTMTYADTLKADIYFAPQMRGGQKSPLLLLVHGGGFSSGKRDGDLESGFALAMAQRGYVVASISYDLVRKGQPEGFSCDCPATTKVETFKHVAGNIYQAFDFLVNFSSEFNFDPEKIVLVGSSAGAEAVLHAAYARDHEAFSALEGQGRKFAAVISFAGALIEGVEIKRANGVPALLVHGTDDKLVPYATAPHHYCEQGTPGYIVLQGSGTIAEALQEHGVPSTLITAEGGGHEWANKAYELTDDVSTFLYERLYEKKSGTQHKTIDPQP